MSGPEFHQTGYGRQFFDHQLPELIHQLARIATALEALVKKEASRADQDV